MRRWYRSQIEEIASSRLLAIFGMIMALTHVTTYVFWTTTLKRGFLEFMYDGIPDCWPFAVPCAQRIWLPQAAAPFLGYLYLGLATIALLSYLQILRVTLRPFAHEKKVKLSALGWWALLALMVLKCAIILLDYREMGSYHTVTLYASIIYLFLPLKIEVMQLYLCLFYFFAGLLKFDRDWLSGVSINHSILFLHGRWLVLGCAYVAILETVFVWGLLGRNSWWRWLVLAQLLLLHGFSWPSLSFIFPIMMGLLLVIFPLDWLLNRSEPGVRDVPLGFFSLLKKPAILASVVIFCFVQLLPRLQGGDPAITGEGRVYAFNMFDGRVLCSPEIIAHFKDGSVHDVSQFHFNRYVRVWCDPSQYFQDAASICRKAANDPRFDDLDFFFAASRKSDAGLRPMVRVKNFCSLLRSGKIAFHTIWPNDWIAR